VLAVITWKRRRWALGLPLLLTSLLTLAPALPFGFDLISWRLLLMSFVPTSLGLALVAAQNSRLITALIVGTSIVSLFYTIPHNTRTEPDYAAWSKVVPVLQEKIPVGAQVVAHRGVCGFVWAGAERVCQNFEPPGETEGWWRIVYGMGEERLSAFSPTPPIRLMLGYTLVTEAAWRRFRKDHGEGLPLVRHPKNPYLPRPEFVYGPKQIPIKAP
ncbi:MAG: hypothetical protein MK135_11020, partial [Polyangiaceae bacterium]|nr:hypothetical protein [Polyangiaceae bacterium]